MSLATIRDGTTDITRTVHWGTPTDMQKVNIWVVCLNSKFSSFKGYFEDKFLIFLSEQHQQTCQATTSVLICMSGPTGGLHQGAQRKH